MRASQSLKRWATCAASLSALMLAGCAGLNGAVPAVPVPEHLFHDAWFQPPATPVRADAVLALSPAMRAFMVSDIAHLARRENSPQRALIQALYTPNLLRLEYDATMTRDTAQAFDARSGNCLSLVLMTAAFARALDREGNFHSADSEETWSRRGNLLVRSSHVNVSLAPRLLSQGTRRDPALLTVDFLAAQELQGLRTRDIGQATVLAEVVEQKVQKRIPIPMVLVDPPVVDLVNADFVTDKPRDELTYLNIVALRSRYESTLSQLEQYYGSIVGALEQNPKAVITVKKGDKTAWGYFIPAGDPIKAQDDWNKIEKRVRAVFYISRSLNPPEKLIQETIEIIRRAAFARDPLGYILMKRPELLEGRKLVVVNQGDDDGSLQQALSGLYKFGRMIEDLVNKYSMSIDQVLFLKDILEKPKTVDDVRFKVIQNTSKAQTLREAVEQNAKIPEPFKKSFLEYLLTYDEMIVISMEGPTKAVKIAGLQLDQIPETAIIIAAAPFLDIFRKNGFISQAMIRLLMGKFNTKSSIN